MFHLVMTLTAESKLFGVCADAFCSYLIEFSGCVGLRCLRSEAEECHYEVGSEEIIWDLGVKTSVLDLRNYLLSS